MTIVKYWNRLPREVLRCINTLLHINNLMGIHFLMQPNNNAEFCWPSLPWRHSGWFGFWFCFFPFILLCFFVQKGKRYHEHMIDLLFIRASGSFPEKPLSSWSIPSVYCHIRLFLPKCRSWHFALQKFVRFQLSHYSSWSRTFLYWLQTFEPHSLANFQLTFLFNYLFHTSSICQWRCYGRWLKAILKARKKNPLLLLHIKPVT